jgi:hypothetical protein
MAITTEAEYGQTVSEIKALPRKGEAGLCNIGTMLQRHT